MKLRFFNGYTGQQEDITVSFARVAFDHLWDFAAGGKLETVAVYREVDGSEEGSANLDGWYLLASDGSETRFTDWWVIA